MTLQDAFEILKHDKFKVIACRYSMVNCYAYYFFNGEHPCLFVKADHEPLLEGFKDTRLIPLANWMPPLDPGTTPNLIELIPLENIFNNRGEIDGTEDSNTQTGGNAV